MGIALSGISSMATRLVLAELTAAYRETAGVNVSIESVGGVDAAKRVQAGEAFDVVILAADAIDKLIAGGSALTGSRIDLVHSPVAIGVRSGNPRPDISSEAALRASVLAARRLGYSTGPSGAALLGLFERWGIADELRERIVQAPPGVPVGKLVADGAVELGFQQLSEMLSQSGIDVIGAMPPGTEITTIFSGAICAASTQAEAARKLLDYLQSPAAADAKRRHGMEAA